QAAAPRRRPILRLTESSHGPVAKSTWLGRRPCPSLRPVPPRPPPPTRTGTRRGGTGFSPQSRPRPSVSAAVAHGRARQLLGRRSPVVLSQPAAEPPHPGLFPGPGPDDPAGPDPLALP